MAAALQSPSADNRGDATNPPTSRVGEFSAWLIDLDGTLYRPLGVKLAMVGQLTLRGRGAIRTVHAFRKELERVRLDDCNGHADPFRSQLSRTAENVGIDVTAVEATVIEWMFRRPGPWLRFFRRRSLIREISAFRQSGGRTALVSDYPAKVKLQAIGAAELFEVVVASGEPGGPPRLKPAPDGYLLAAKRLGVDPADCLVIGDRIDTDGEAARRAGMAFRKVR